VAKNPVETDIENYRHDAAKRINIPTAENQSLVPDDDKALKVLRYPRNPDLDPQLVWRGKDAEDAGPLEVAAPPIYIQEKIQPRALIENLRRQSAVRRLETAPQIDFFHDFNGLDDREARTEFYQHDQNWQNRMILGDSLLVMGSLAEREALRGKVQCIYFDPPYGIKFNSNWQPSIKSTVVKDGREDSVSREPEVVRAFRDTWKDGINSYLSYLRDRLMVARDLLKETGSIFVQIGDENVHRVRAVMDEVFGDENFISQIGFFTTTSQTSKYLPPVADFILWYARSRDNLKYKNILNEKDYETQASSAFALFEHDMQVQRKPTGQPGERLLVYDNLTSRSGGGGALQPFVARGQSFRPATGGWKTSQVGLGRLDRAGRIGVTAVQFSCFHPARQPQRAPNLTTRSQVSRPKLIFQLRNTASAFRDNRRGEPQVERTAQPWHWCSRNGRLLCSLF
jgi:adenine-specific DNA-methyltransferase